VELSAGNLQLSDETFTAFVSKMTDNVSSGTLNQTQLNHCVYVEKM